MGFFGSKKKKAAPKPKDNLARSRQQLLGGAHSLIEDEEAANGDLVGKNAPTDALNASLQGRLLN